jgi:EAL domain-containing protein (putative c-di-GMP-specific phosphodiesterase class I)
VDVRTEELVGMEALIRWRHPELGLIAPAQFLPLAGEAGLMGAIGTWVLEEACTQAKSWQDAGLPPIRMAVNLSAQQFQYRNLVHDIDQILKQTRLHPRYLDLEVTEGVAMSPSSATIPVLRDLKAMGVQTSVDDFGTGYSSLASLNRFEFDRLKIDKAFIRDITTSIEDLAIASMVIALAKSLNRRSLAEGVETVEQLEMLRSRSCDEAQGFLFSPPVPADEAREFIRSSRCGWAFHAKPIVATRAPLQLRERRPSILD